MAEPQGTYTAADGDKTDADGDKTVADRDKDVGNIKNDKRHGQGIFEKVLISFISLPVLLIVGIFKIIGRCFLIAVALVGTYLAGALILLFFAAIMIALAFLSMYLGG